MLVGVVALLVIGPKACPRRCASSAIGCRARGVARQFRSGFDTMMREAELQEMEKKWAEENARIMREHRLRRSRCCPWPWLDHEDARARVLVEPPLIAAAKA